MNLSNWSYEYSVEYAKSDADVQLQKTEAWRAREKLANLIKSQQGYQGAWNNLMAALQQKMSCEVVSYDTNTRLQNVSLPKVIWSRNPNGDGVIIGREPSAVGESQFMRAHGIETTAINQTFELFKSKVLPGVENALQIISAHGGSSVPPGGTIPFSHFVNTPLQIYLGQGEFVHRTAPAVFKNACAWSAIALACDSDVMCIQMSLINEPPVQNSCTEHAYNSEHALCAASGEHETPMWKKASTLGHEQSIMERLTTRINGLGSGQPLFETDTLQKIVDDVKAMPNPEFIPPDFVATGISYYLAGRGPPKSSQGGPSQNFPPPDGLRCDGCWPPARGATCN